MHVGEEKLETIKSTLARVKTDLGELANEVVELGRTETKDARAKLEERVKQRVEYIQKELAEEGKGTKQALDQLITQVKEHPVASLVAALGVGFLVGKMLEKR